MVSRELMLEQVVVPVLWLRGVDESSRCCMWIGLVRLANLPTGPISASRAAKVCAACEADIRAEQTKTQPHETRELFELREEISKMAPTGENGAPTPVIFVDFITNMAENPTNGAQIWTWPKSLRMSHFSESNQNNAQLSNRQQQQRGS